MINPYINKIVIVGGGSAGWMAASTLIKSFPDKEIILIESPNIPTVGVGESTLGAINNWLAALDIKDEDFMAACDASYKLGIKFTDFEEVDSGTFQYPFGDPCLDGVSNLGTIDWHLKKLLNPELPTSDYATTFIPSATLIELDRINTNSTGVFDTFKFHKDSAYHFDAVKFAIWLRDQYAIPKGVKHIKAEVTSVTTNEDGVDYLVLDSGEQIKADLFLDCTGFKRLLIGGALNEPFDSFDHELPNNRAWACQVPYIDIEKELEVSTNCTALGNGWCWNTPLISRIGTGYVYCDKFISSEDALEEFKNYLCSNKMKVPRTREQIEEYSFRELKFQSGISHRGWVKNVCAIGLSAGFLEPLESTGLYSTHEFLLHLVKSLGHKKTSQWDRDVYNTTTRLLFTNFVEFVAIHYSMSRRTDTEYWRSIFNKTFDPGMADLVNRKQTGYHDVAIQYMMNWTYRTDNPQGLHFIATGLNFLPLDHMRLRTMEFLHRRNYREIVENSNKTWEKNKKKWRKAAEASPSHYHYLKNTIYKNAIDD